MEVSQGTGMKLREPLGCLKLLECWEGGNGGGDGGGGGWGSRLDHIHVGVGKWLHAQNLTQVLSEPLFSCGQTKKITTIATKTTTTIKLMKRAATQKR